MSGVMIAIAAVTAWCLTGCLGSWLGNRGMRRRYPDNLSDPDEEFDMYFVGMLFGPFNLVAVIVLALADERR